jgi:peptidoglycan biosynthesis protein MviN/MurJ (putative lipid II flippase)
LAVAARYVARVGLHARLAGVLVGEVTVAVGLGLLLVGRYGPTGVAAAAVVAETTAAAVLVHMACQHLGIRPWRFWAGRSWRLALIVTPAMGAAGLFVLVKSIRTVRELVLQMGIVIILNAVAAFAAWYLMETRPEQDID